MDWEKDPELKKLRAEFVCSLSQTKEKLAHCIDELKNLPENSLLFLEKYEEIKNIVHRLAGAAESYGFIDLGRCAEEFDEWIEAQWSQTVSKKKCMELGLALLTKL